MDSDGEYSADPFPLLRAAKLGDVHALRRFIAAGEDINTEDEDGYTPLIGSSAMILTARMTLLFRTDSPAFLR